MAPRTKKRRASDVIILSSPPKKFLVPIYISISSEDEGNPPAKKQTPSPGVRVKENGTTPNPGKGNEKFGVSVSTSRGLTISINDSDSDNEVLAATGQYELLRSWVDAGIEIAMREMAGEDCKSAYTLTYSAKSNQTHPTSSIIEVQHHPSKLPPSVSQLSHTQSSNPNGVKLERAPPWKPQYLSNPASSLTPREPLSHTSHNISPPIIPTTRMYTSVYTPVANSGPKASAAVSRYNPVPILPPKPRISNDVPATILPASKAPKATLTSISPTKAQIISCAPGQCLPLAPKQVISLALETSKPLPPYSVLPPGDYLGFYDLVERYSVPHRSGLHTNNPAWISWLERLGIDGPQYRNALDHANRSWFKANIEDCWAKEPSEKRRAIEKVAIWHKYGSFVNLHSIPLRERDVTLSSSIPFHEVERNYFSNIRTFSSHDDIIKQRDDWLSRIGFCEAQKYPLPETPAHTQRLNELYASLHILQCKAIFSSAKYLKLLVKPPAPSWGDLEDKYAIYPASCFTSHAEYKSRRRDWLRSLELDSWPFSYVNMTEKYNGVAEIEWSEKSQETRTAVENHAKAMKDGLIPYASSWSAVEDIFGFSAELDFSGRQLRYRLTRNAWLRTIGMGNYVDELVPMEVLRTRWASKSFDEKRIILEKARTERETFCTERLTKPPNPFLNAEPPSTSRTASSVYLSSAQSSSAMKPASTGHSRPSVTSTMGHVAVTTSRKNTKKKPSRRYRF